MKTRAVSGAEVTQTFGKMENSAVETALLDSNSANLDNAIVQIVQAGIAGFVSNIILTHL